MASMLQVSLMGYASGGAFLGLAYFDLYYTLIAVMVICTLLVGEQIATAEAAENITVRRSAGLDISNGIGMNGMERKYQ